MKNSVSANVEKKSDENKVHKKIQDYIICGVNLIISMVLIIVSLCLGYTEILFPNEQNTSFYSTELILAFFIVQIVLIIGIAGFQFLRSRSGEVKYLIIESFLRISILPFCACIFTFTANSAFFASLFILLSGIISSLGYWLAILLILATKGILKFCVAIAKLFHNLFNIGYKGEPPIKYSDKITEVFLQIVLLPVSVFAECCAFYFFICAHFLGGLVIQHLIYRAMKKENKEEGYSYQVAPSDNVVTSTVTHNVRDRYGDIVGTYDTTESHVEHDSGYRYRASAQFEAACWNTLIALPCRIISLILSILALVIPCLYISVMKPKTTNAYNHAAFRYFDILMMNRT